MNVINSKDLTDINILYEDNHIIIINKKPSDIVQGDKTGDVPLADTVKKYLKIKYNKPGNVYLGVVHRLDRPASGVIIFAKTSKALTRLNEMIRNHELKKIYWAVVKNKPPKQHDHLSDYLLKNQQQNKSYIVDKETPKALTAELKYKVIAKSDEYYLLEIELITGRHHQIRVQLSGKGCPVKGDIKYRFPRTNSDASIHLHARSLEFIHPVKKQKMKITAQPPDETLWNFFSKQLCKK